MVTKGGLMAEIIHDLINSDANKVTNVFSTLLKR